jgi:site-specific DNA-methyltransferase (adenine-specific)
MSTQAGFAIRGRNPDVLTCIANLSNDEVFTPPEFANRMLNTLAEAWAKAHDGEDVWTNPDVRFLDPFTKSGRLTQGLEEKIPDLESRVDHILTQQVFGIGITYLTSLLARRSVYCSKWANGEHSIAKSFDNESGNVWFERLEHTWEGGTEWVYTADAQGNQIEKLKNGRCKFCGAPQLLFDRAEGLETHAYAFIHTDDIKARLSELFGGDMQFDVVVGNPPYQMTGGGGGSNDSSIYHLFVQQAKQLEPRYLSMVIPSRWLAGGRGLDDFRKEMLSDGHLRRLVDYTKMSVAFPGVDFEGGVGYFLWDRDDTGPCLYTLHLGDEQLEAVERDLGAHDVFVRDSRAAEILDKVLAFAEPTMKELVSGDTPFGLATNYADFSQKRFKGALELHVSVKQKRVVAWMKDSVTKNRQLIPEWKLFLPKAYGERGAIPAIVLGPSIAAGPNAVCTQTYVAAGPFQSEAEARSCQAYLRTRFARLLISLRKITQDLPRATYSWLPQQEWSHEWTDQELFDKYGITGEEVSFIESMIRPMELPAEAAG